MCCLRTRSIPTWRVIALEGHPTHAPRNRTCARPQEPDLHQAVIAHVHELHVPVVGLYGGPDQVEDPLHMLANGL
jgi:hypothetical protein